MPIWNIAPITNRPEVTLRDWAVFDVPLPGNDQPTRHLVGRACEDRQGQVSSAVSSFDPVSGKCVTSSGRVYCLVGRPGIGLDAEYVWNTWKGLWEVTQVDDVTQQVFDAMQAAQVASDDPKTGR